MAAPKNDRKRNFDPDRPRPGQPRPGMQQPKKKGGGKQDPMSNMRTKGRYGLKLIRDIAYGNFNIYTQGHIFRDMDLVNATLGEINNKLFDIQVHVQAISCAYQGCTDQRVLNLLWRDQQQQKAYEIMQYAMGAISVTGDVGHLLVLANSRPPLRHNISIRAGWSSRSIRRFSKHGLFLRKGEANPMAAEYNPLNHPRRDQIDKLRSLVEGTRYVLKIDDGSEYDSAFHLFVWDGEQEVVHIISQNPDINTQSTHPFRIRSIDYAQVRNINGYFT